MRISAQHFFEPLLYITHMHPSSHICTPSPILQTIQTIFCILILPVTILPIDHSSNAHNCLFWNTGETCYIHQAACYIFWSPLLTAYFLSMPSKTALLLLSLNANDCLTLFAFVHLALAALCFSFLSLASTPSSLSLSLASTPSP